MGGVRNLARYVLGYVYPAVVRPFNGAEIVIGKFENLLGHLVSQLLLLNGW